ncbi:Uncharacterized protein PBTT_04476 [Plasmodiophora brassicae]|uniref:Uncharacterized protein n=1 Tax=Plasmodiophora brassicae TaxID=37360 RepID=A0A0G4J806_PLABS|nr:hypothetical protein PBRA_009404 [Plasmodiophora brassicae]SPQ96533.1 unnamed protein product [Plasmodiophora brassicae]
MATSTAAHVPSPEATDAMLQTHLHTKMESPFLVDKVVPDLIKQEPGQVAALRLSLQADTVINPGDVVDADIAYKSEIILDWKPGKDALYTILMVHLSPVNEPKREWLNWLTINAPALDLDKGKTLFEYESVKFVERGGSHRIVLLVFEQERELDADAILRRIQGAEDATDSRDKFKTQEFINNLDLNVPVAGNFFLVSHPDLAPSHSES